MNNEKLVEAIKAIYIICACGHEKGCKCKGYPGRPKNEPDQTIWHDPEATGLHSGPAPSGDNESCGEKPEQASGTRGPETTLPADMEQAVNWALERSKIRMRDLLRHLPDAPDLDEQYDILAHDLRSRLSALLPGQRTKPTIDDIYHVLKDMRGMSEHTIAGTIWRKFMPFSAEELAQPRFISAQVSCQKQETKHD